MTPFQISPELQAHLRRGENRATTAVQLSGALAQPELETILTPTPMPVYLRYGNEVIFDGAVAYWRLGESEGPSALDRRSLHHGTFTGSVVYGVEGALVANIPAEVDTAVSLGGGYFSVPHDPALSFATDDDFSVELWVLCVQASGFPAAIVDKADAGVFPYRLRLVAGGAVEAARSDGTNTPTLTSASVTDGAWHYVLFSKLGTTLTLWVDDVTVSTSDTTVAATDTTVPLVIGSPQLAATLDEVAIYPAALAPELVERHRKAAAGVAL